MVGSNNLEHQLAAHIAQMTEQLVVTTTTTER